MAAAGVGSSVGCAGCSSMQQPERNVANVGYIAAGSITERRSRREQVYYIKRNVFPEGLKLAASSRGTHVVLEGSTKAPLSCTSVDAKSENLADENVEESGGPKVKLRLMVDHQIQFGEHVALLGSNESLGLWNNRVMMEWTEDGWIVDLEADPGETFEYKHVIINKGGDVVWEDGENRVLVVPDDCSKVYQVVSHWSTTSEAIEFEEMDESQGLEVVETDAEAEQELMTERGESEVVDGIQSPENGAIEVEKEPENVSVNSEVMEETQAPKVLTAILTKLDLQETEVNANGSAMPEKSDLPYNESFSKPEVKGNQTLTTAWGPVSIILSILMIAYGFLSLGQN
ncbi:unnamed protein product [Calypogeia fissa]